MKVKSQVSDGRSIAQRSPESHQRELVDGSIPAYNADPACSEKLAEIVAEICQRRDYHLLESKTYDDHFRCLLSLLPEHDLSTALEKVKANCARECGRQFGMAAPIWARGYLARSVGRVIISTVKQYIERQAEHLEYSKRHSPPIYRYRAEYPSALSAAHSVFDLNHHLVVSTRYRASVFDSKLGHELGAYWLKVAAKYGFAIDRITILPDYAHLLVRTAPKLSVETCVLGLLNRRQGMNNPPASAGGILEARIASIL